MKLDWKFLSFVASSVRIWIAPQIYPSIKKKQNQTKQNKKQNKIKKPAKISLRTEKCASYFSLPFVQKARATWTQAK